jgi:hypothetical protein
MRDNIYKASSLLAVAVAALRLLWNRCGIAAEPLRYPAVALAAVGKPQMEYQPALQGLDYGKPRTYYPDYVQADNGLQYKVVKDDTGDSPTPGDKVSIDWEGYTIGSFGFASVPDAKQGEGRRV